MYTSPDSHEARVADFSAQLAREKRKERRLTIATEAMKIFLLRTVRPFDPALVAESSLQMADAMLDAIEGQAESQS